MNFRLLIAPLFILSLAGSSLAKADDDPFSYIRSMIQRELKKFDNLQDKWPGIETKLGNASKQYKAAALSINRCKRSVWRTLFKDSLAELEAARVKLEDSRKQLEIARHKGLSALKTQQRSILILEAEYAKKAKDIAYYTKYNDIVGNITDNYYDVTNDVVYVGYQDYISGIGELSKGYKAASKDCERPLPRLLLTSVVDIVFGKVNIVQLLAGQILDRIPNEYKTK